MQQQNAVNPCKNGHLSFIDDFVTSFMNGTRSALSFLPTFILGAIIFAGVIILTMYLYQVDLDYIIEKIDSSYMTILSVKDCDPRGCNP